MIHCSLQLGGFRYKYLLTLLVICFSLLSPILLSLVFRIRRFKTETVGCFYSNVVCNKLRSLLSPLLEHAHIDEKKQQTNWSPSLHTHTQHTHGFDQRKSANTHATMANTHIGSTFYAYIPVWRLKKKSRDDETNKKRRKQKQRNALSLLRSIQCHRQTAAVAAVSRTRNQTRNSFEWIQYWADNRMVMKECYSFLGNKRQRLERGSPRFSFQFVVSSFTRILGELLDFNFLRERLDASEFDGKTEDSVKYNSPRDCVRYSTAKQSHWVEWRVKIDLKLKKKMLCLWDRIFVNLWTIRKSLCDVRVYLWTIGSIFWIFVSVSFVLVIMR